MALLQLGRIRTCRGLRAIVSHPGHAVPDHRGRHRRRRLEGRWKAARAAAHAGPGGARGRHFSGGGIPIRAPALSGKNPAGGLRPRLRSRMDTFDRDGAGGESTQADHPHRARLERDDREAVRMAMTAAPIILVPGFWLGAWAWDEVAESLRAAGHEVTALTLPGMASADADRSTITFADHVAAICDAVRAVRPPVVLAVHSASGFSGYAASDQVPERIAAMVYVDSAPGKGALDPGFEGVEKSMIWGEIEAEENLDGLSEEQKETFRRRALPVPGGVLRETVNLTNDARCDIPSTIICTGFRAE